MSNNLNETKKNRIYKTRYLLMQTITVFISMQLQTDPLIMITSYLHNLFHEPSTACLYFFNIQYKFRCLKLISMLQISCLTSKRISEL